MGSEPLSIKEAIVNVLRLQTATKRSRGFQGDRGAISHRNDASAECRDFRRLLKRAEEIIEAAIFVGKTLVELYNYETRQAPGN